MISVLFKKVLVRITKFSVTVTVIQIKKKNKSRFEYFLAIKRGSHLSKHKRLKKESTQMYVINITSPFKLINFTNYYMNPYKIFLYLPRKTSKKF